jgi:hypothetical protein
VAERALNADRFEVARRVEEAGDADHGFELEQLDRDGWVREVDATSPEITDQAPRQRFVVDFQPDSQGGGGVHRRDRLVQPQGIAPEGLVAERVVSKDIATGAEQLRRVGGDPSIGDGLSIVSAGVRARPH